MIERERSYVFDIESAHRFCRQVMPNIVNPLAKPTKIIDHYLEPNLRIRYAGSCIQLIHKSGDKATGERTETACPLDEKSAKMLQTMSKLKVEKNRYHLPGPPDYCVSMDIIEQPMKLAVLEVERIIGDDPVSSNIVEHIFKTSPALRECPLNSWNLFKRKIGICGAPSSGKSESAKWLSWCINTKMGGNAFHVQEFATTFIQKYRRLPTFVDQFFIWYGQHNREKNAQTANIVVSDCPTFLTYIYLQMQSDQVFDPRRALYSAKIYKRVLEDLSTYTDLVFLRLLAYKDNNVRYQTYDEALKVEERIERFLLDHNVAYRHATYKDMDRVLDGVFFINRVNE